MVCVKVDINNETRIKVMEALPRVAATVTLRVASVLVRAGPRQELVTTGELFASDPVRQRSDRNRMSLIARRGLATATRPSIVRLINSVNHGSVCPCHSCQSHSTGLQDIGRAAQAISSKGMSRHNYAVPANAGSTDYAFEVSASNLRFGEGVTVSRGARRR